MKMFESDARIKSGMKPTTRAVETTDRAGICPIP